MPVPIIHKKKRLKPSTVQAYIKRFIKKCILECAREITANGDVKIQDCGTLVPQIYPYVSVHVCYNPYMNKAYIEYHIDDKLRHYIAPDKFARWLNGRINANMWEQLGIYPEILHEEDGKSEKCDLTDKLTPYVVGYWKSLNGCFMFVEDEAWTRLHAGNLGMPGISQEKPAKKIEDFHKIVMDINNKYSQVDLNKQSKDEYITKYYEILAQYKDDKETLDSKIAELDEEYSIKNEVNKMVPYMYEEYMQKYEEFFGVKQRNIRATSVTYRFQLLNFI